ncbi:LytTR family DNA-binding domain-containing protein [Flavihumibacter rivuli]|uniref:LytR/AlgR family response regulator transcription factor n=1 Tax=Flavihumibacter rivuli TaxID=2838156 RepID=UPI001BDEB4A6|nr:LytTR family DNA-binding domain-containing protein [Flavihumibacter rivuli]ULQ55199.1 LytTR family DNA-binding domain-containing protein [Flavihumibacter rivuli]
MNVLIIEDEKLSAQKLGHMLTAYDHQINIVAVIPSAKKAIQFLSTQPAPDLLFMDVELEDDNCFTIFQSISIDIPVIFTTAYHSYMMHAFKVNSIDYLLKPIDEDELIAALNKFKRTSKPIIDLRKIADRLAERESKRYRDRFMVNAGSRLKTIEQHQVSYFYYRDYTTFLVMNNHQQYPVEYSLDRLCTQLDPGLFFRINRKMIISHQSIATILVLPKGRIKLELIPAHNEEVLVSLDRITPFKEWLGK